MRTQDSLTESSWIRFALTATALVFLVLFLGLPLLVVFTEAMRLGIGAWWDAIREPDALSARPVRRARDELIEPRTNGGGRRWRGGCRRRRRPRGTAEHGQRCQKDSVHGELPGAHVAIVRTNARRAQVVPAFVPTVTRRRSRLLDPRVRARWREVGLQRSEVDGMEQSVVQLGTS